MNSKNLSTLAIVRTSSSNTYRKEDIVQVNENLLENSVRVYPNPTTGKFEINLKMWQFENLKMKGIEIFNIYGEKVYEEALTLKGTNTSTLQGGRQIISVSLPSGTGQGIYFLKVITDRGTVNKKIVINK